MKPRDMKSISENYSINKDIPLELTPQSGDYGIDIFATKKEGKR